MLTISGLRRRGYTPTSIRNFCAEIGLAKRESRIDMGVLDVNLDAANVFETRLTKYRIPHEWHIFLGTHNEEYWSAHVVDYLKWYAEGWEQKSG